MGSHIMAEEGYDPRQMARFFEKLNAKGGFTTIQFFSDHPNPENRSKAIDDEARRLPQRSYGYQTGQFSQMKNGGGQHSRGLAKKAIRRGTRATVRPMGLTPCERRQRYTSLSHHEIRSESVVTAVRCSLPLCVSRERCTRSGAGRSATATRTGAHASEACDCAEQRSGIGRWIDGCQSSVCFARRGNHSCCGGKTFSSGRAVGA